MKMITAVLTSSTWPDVFDALQVIDVDGLTLTELAIPADTERGLRIEIVAADDQAEQVAETILQATPPVSDAVPQVWISAVDGFVPVQGRGQDF